MLNICSEERSPAASAPACPRCPSSRERGRPRAALRRLPCPSPAAAGTELEPQRRARAGTCWGWEQGAEAERPARARLAAPEEFAKRARSRAKLADPLGKRGKGGTAFPRSSSKDSHGKSGSGHAAPPVWPIRIYCLPPQMRCEHQVPLPGSNPKRAGPNLNLSVPRKGPGDAQRGPRLFKPCSCPSGGDHG